MAKGNAVWGIDIGQCALKALQCRPHEKDPRQMVVESFDYIEYPQILSQPEADPAELVRDALKEFLSRNDLTGDTVAVSVAGQSGLARFIKLPPVEAKKIPDIVKYEARQQIPFSLEDVVWDYQQLRGGSEEDGFALEPEVGLFAMKRDQVARALAPLEESGIEVDVIQLTPLAVYNYVCFDRLAELNEQPYDPQNPPTSTVVISLGTDTTDLVVTNGFRVWQRNIPIGGNHFTRALSKELKLTFVKAEHLKRNAMQADDPKAVFQAMRPVFSDLLAEIQRSLGYFMSLDKKAKIGEVIALGNAMKLPGLQRYLAQNLEQEVKPIDDFQRLSAGSAAGAAQFKENLLSFAVSYGLCAQGMDKAEIHTNLLPEEIVRRRLIRGKKPWAVAGAAAILAGLAFNYFTHVSAWAETQTPAMSAAISQADSVSTKVSSWESERTSLKAKADEVLTIKTGLTSNVEGRVRWLELIKAISAALPKDETPHKEEGTMEEIAKAIMSRNELHITSIDARRFNDLQSEYLGLIQSKYNDARATAASEETTVETTDVIEVDPYAAGAGGTDATFDTAPVVDSGAGGAGAPGAWVIQLTGFHYHNDDRTNQATRFVNNTLIKALEEGTVLLPDGYDEATQKWTGKLVRVPIADLKIHHPFVLVNNELVTVMKDLDEELKTADGTTGDMGGRPPVFAPPVEGAGLDGAATADPAAQMRIVKLKRYDFVVQFCWEPTTRAQRREMRIARKAAEDAAAEAEAAADAAGVVEEDLEQQ
ncbi:MAG: type IV pilus assembly protein PilM [Pirellulales bacterium]|nr:type IV pilus assembly protein PilM [Pirellulales bacterium]